MREEMLEIDEWWKDYDWEVRDVMEYFGEYLDYDENAAKGVMDKVGWRGYFGSMNAIREILIDYGKCVPFRVVYRRAK